MRRYVAACFAAQCRPTQNKMIEPQSIDELQHEIRKANTTLVVRGGGSKRGLSTVPVGNLGVGMQRLSGVVEYDPSEYTMTAHAGTTLEEVTSLLQERGQYLPFDPPLVGRGATLGGTVASGLSGSGRLRYGGVSDFLIEVEFVDGGGHHVRGGGRVVKNAAGFDFPKLMVGSLGHLGILTRLTFKVFPKAAASGTLRFCCDSADAAVDLQSRLFTSQLELQALDLEAPSTVVVRHAGVKGSLAQREERVEALAGRSGERVRDDEDYWRSVRDFSWVSDSAALIKIPLASVLLLDLDQALSTQDIERRYSVGGNVCWATVIDARGLEHVHRICVDLGLSGLVVWSLREGGDTVGLSSRIGVLRDGGAFGRRLKAALDPQRRFPES